MSSPVNAVIDLSHHNSSPDFAAAAKDGIFGIIHKATQGLLGVDPTYHGRKAEAAKAGLKWGAYHFGTGSEGTQQATAFLNAIGDPSGILPVLDFEANPAGPSMSLEEARAFVTHIRQATGIWPGLYSGHYIKELLGAHKDPVLGNCWFWLAQYGPTAVVPPAWPRWTLWQYTDGMSGDQPHHVNGIGNCDRDRFNGSAADLALFWDKHTV